MEIKAIDIHVHPKTEEFITASGARAEQMAAYFKRENKPVSFQELADQYRDRRMMAVLMNSTDVTTSGLIPVPNDTIAQAVRDHPDVFIGFGIVEPQQGKIAIDEIRRFKDLGLRGIGEPN